MSHRKILLTALTVAIVLALLAGCASTAGNTSTTGNTSSSTVQSTTKSTTQAAVSEPEKITWFALGSPSSTLDRVNKAMTDLLQSQGLNVTMDLQIVAGADYDTQLSTMLASGEEFDLFNHSYSSIFGFASSGGVYNINDNDLSQYIPDIVKVLGNNVIDCGKLNGKLYAISSVHEMAQSLGYFYNQDMADKYGIDMSNIKTMDDLDPIFKKIHTKASDIICLYTELEGELNVFNNIDFVNNNSSLSAAMFYNNDSKSIFNYWKDDSVKKTFEKIHQWYQDGYLNKDTTADLWTLFEDGKIFCYPSFLKPSNNVEVTTSKARISQVEFTGPMIGFRAFPGGWGIAVSSTSHSPQMAMQVLNMAYKNADFINLLTFGQKDTDYTLSSDNIVSFKDTGYATEEYACTAWQMGNHYLNYVTETQKKNGLPDIWIKLQNFNQSAQKLDHGGFYYNPGNCSTEVTAIKNVFGQYSSLLSSGSVDAASTLADFNKALDDNGMQTVLDDMNKQYQEFLASK